MPRIPHRIPAPPVIGSGGGTNPLPSADQFSLFDVALNGVGYMYSNTPVNPLIRETLPYTKDQIDQAQSPGEQTLTSWWIKSQESFHGGAGQLNLEPPVETPVSHVRFDMCKNVDPFTPGLVTRLPDTSVLTSASVTKVVALPVSGADAVAYLKGDGTVHLLTDLDGAKTDTTFTAVSSILDIATDGARVYAADALHVYALNPASMGTSSTLCTFPATATTGPVIGWAKSRLMLGVNGAVYQVDVSATGVTLGATQLLIQHPTPGWTWRCFSDSPTAILAAGDAGAFSEVDSFVLNEVSGAPVLQYGGSVTGPMPVGERVLSMCNVMGGFLAVGTTRGVRVGQYDIYGRLQLGPLALLPTDPTIPANAVFGRDRFVYAVGKAYDEGGLLAVDLGTQTDQAGRFAWAPHLIAPTTTATAATTGTTLPVSARIVFAIPGTGLLLEGTGAGTGREAWLRTSRIRWATTEPKLFKLGSIRADIANSDVTVIGTTPLESVPLGTLGFTTDTPPDFRLPSGLNEWLQLEMHLVGAPAKLRSYAVKALPGTRRQVHIKQVLAVYDSETTRSGQNIRDTLGARGRLNFLEELAASGDEVLLQEFTPAGVISTVVVVERVSFTQVGRPTKRSDVGGDATVLLRTVDL